MPYDYNDTQCIKERAGSGYTGSVLGRFGLIACGITSTGSDASCDCRIDVGGEAGRHDQMVASHATPRFRAPHLTLLFKIQFSSICSFIQSKC